MIVRVALLLAALGGVAGAETMAIIPPDGWIEDATDNPRIRAFHAPSDPQSRFFITQGMDSGSPTTSVQHYLEQELADPLLPGAHVDSRAQRGDDDYATAEATLSFPDGTREALRVAASPAESGGAQTLAGSCLGRDAAFRECQARLSLVNTPHARDAYEGLRRSLVGGLLVVVALTAIGVAMRRVLRARAKTRKVPFIEHELVTLTGVARAADACIDAPLSGRKCIAYRARARLFTAGTIPELVGEPTEAASAPFIITTPMGDVRVDANRLEFSIAPNAIVEHSPSREEAFLIRNGFTAKHLEGAAFDELVIEPQHTVVISGMIAITRGPPVGEHGYRDAPPGVVTLVAPHAKPLTILRVW